MFRNRLWKRVRKIDEIGTAAEFPTSDMRTVPAVEDRVPIPAGAWR